jgi:hypothetical protein
MSDQSDVTKLATVAQRLLALTQKGGIDWEKDPRSEDSYSYSTTDSTVIIRSRDADGDIPYVISVRDQDGDTVATLTVTDSFDNLAQKKTISDLYKAARRSALQTDSVLDKLIDDLAFDEGKTE